MNAAGRTATLNKLNSGMYIAVGTGTNAESDSDTALVTEIARSSVAVYTVTGPSQIAYDAYMTAAQVGGQTIREVMLVDAAAGGNCYSRKLKTLAVPAGSGTIVTLTMPIATP